MTLTTRRAFISACRPFLPGAAAPSATMAVGAAPEDYHGFIAGPADAVGRKHLAAMSAQLFRVDIRLARAQLI
jgi:hypothetical protein